MWKTGIVVLATASTSVAKITAWDVPHFGWGQVKIAGATPPMNTTTKSGKAFFQQTLEHDNALSPKFQQQYLWSTEYWKGPGSPVVFFTPGEADLAPYTSYLTNKRQTGVLAQRLGAAIVAVEHRYWGESSPTNDLSSENLQPLTLYNSLQDFINLAKTADLPWATKDARSNAADVPWISIGGSYSGAISAWLESTSPGTFWAYHASSGVPQAIENYADYFLPIQQNMPSNCSRDVSQVIDYADNVILNGNKQQIQSLKKMFGLQNVTSNADFMGVLENGPWLWQGNQFYTGYSDFFKFCDTVEGVYNVTGAKVPDSNGVGLSNALKGYAKWVKESFLPTACKNYGYGYKENDTGCFDTFDYNNPLFRDTSLQNQVDRAWVWMTCNEPFGYFQTGRNVSEPTIVSRLIDVNYWERQCGLYFPDGPNGETYGLKRGKHDYNVNDFTGGWDDIKRTRITFANGQADPWREAGVSAESRPGGPMKSTADTPIWVVPSGFHTSDLVTKNGDVNAPIKKIQDEIIDQLAKWVGEFPKKGGSSSTTSAATSTTLSTVTTSKAASTTTAASSTKSSAATTTKA